MASFKFDPDTSRVRVFFRYSGKQWNRTTKVESRRAAERILVLVEETLLDLERGKLILPEYRARGWCIGSGAVESACKTVVGQRLKLAGMRWGEDGAHAVCHLRALYRSEKGQWDAFWRRDYAYN